MSESDVLASVAYAADDELGSEAGAGGALLVATAEVVRAREMSWTVFTRKKHREAVLRIVKRCGVDAQVVAFDGLNGDRARKRFRLDSMVWQAKVWHHAFVQDRRFTHMHHLTLASDVFPAAVHFAPSDVRTVWGPVGGSSVRFNTSPDFRWKSARALKAIWFRILIARVDQTVCLNSWVARQDPSRELPVEQNCSLANDVFDGELPLREASRLLIVGEISSRKRVDLACRALAKSSGNWTLELIGDGPQRLDLINTYTDLIEAGRLFVRGRVPRRDLLQIMKQSGGLIHLSGREGSPWSVAEAIASGCWVLACEGSGADTLVERVLNGGLVVSDSIANDPDRLADFIDQMVEMQPRPNYKGEWDSIRLPGLVDEWLFSERL